jgi:hypothetical protein
MVGPRLRGYLRSGSCGRSRDRRGPFFLPIHWVVNSSVHRDRVLGHGTPGIRHGSGRNHGPAIPFPRRYVLRCASISSRTSVHCAQVGHGRLPHDQLQVVPTSQSGKGPSVTYSPLQPAIPRRVSSFSHAGGRLTGWKGCGHSARRWDSSACQEFDLRAEWLFALFISIDSEDGAATVQVSCRAGHEGVATQDCVNCSQQVPGQAGLEKHTLKLPRPTLR